MRRINIQFIAREAGVSIATVSRVLNNSKPVSPATKKRVMTVIRRFDYQPNELARSLIFQRSKLLGIVAPEESGIFHLQLISSIINCASAHGYEVLTSYVEKSFSLQMVAFRLMRSRQVEGVILLCEDTEEQLKALEVNTGLPFVLTSVRCAGDRYPTITIDDRAASRDATDYLLEYGYRRIAGVFGNTYSSGELRKAGFAEAFERRDLVCDKALQFSCACDIQSGENMAASVLRASPEAVFFASDEMAIGAMNYFRDHHCRVPEDVAVFGFDDNRMAACFNPRLSTVCQPVQSMAKMAVRVLLKIIARRQEADCAENKQPKNAGEIPAEQASEKQGQLYLLPHTLTIRESSQPVKLRQ